MAIWTVRYRQWMADIEGDRQEIRAVAKANGWHHVPVTDDDSKDVFTRGGWRVDVYYDGDEATAAVRFRMGQEVARVSGRPTKATVISWLTSTEPDQV
jgi:hypothetical protein